MERPVRLTMWEIVERDADGRCTREEYRTRIEIIDSVRCIVMEGQYTPVCDGPGQILADCRWIDGPYISGADIDIDMLAGLLSWYPAPHDRQPVPATDQLPAGSTGMYRSVEEMCGWLLVCDYWPPSQPILDTICWLLRHRRA